MKRFVWVLILGVSAAAQTTTITGTLKDLTGAVVTSGKVTFTLTPATSVTISGVARFTPGPPVTCLLNASGQIVAQDGVSVCTVATNTSLQPPGTYYVVATWPYNVKTSTFTFYAVNATYDWSTVVPTPTTSPAQNFVDVFSNQTIGGNKIFTGTQTYGNFYLFTPLTSDLPTAVNQCGSVTCVVDITGTMTLSSSYTVPSTVTLRFDGGTVNVGANLSLTINGGIEAGDTAQIFTGPGGVYGLKVVRPEWFGGQAINLQVQNAMSAGGIVLLRNATYTSAYATTCWTNSNVWFQGAGQPVANGTNQGLTGGTIITGGLAFAGANNIRVTNLGIDNGATFSGSSTNDGLVITGPTGCTSSSPSDAYTTGAYIENVTVMLSSGAVAYHAIRLEHNDGCKLRNIEAYFGSHGLTMKSIHCDAIGYRGHGQGADQIIFKSDTYTPSVHDESVSDIYLDTLSSGNTAINGIIVDAENAGQTSNIQISNVRALNLNNGLVLLSSSGTFGAGAISNVSVDHLSYTTNSNSVGLTQSLCIASTGSGSQTVVNFHATDVDCVNTQGGLTDVPMIFNMPLTNADLEGVHVVGANSTGSVFNGTNITLNGWTEDSQTESKPFSIGVNTNVQLTGYSGSVSTTTSGLASGASLNGNSAIQAAGAFTISSAILTEPVVTVVSSLNSATVLQGSFANNGMLRVRDNTSGGTALFVIDQNSGATAIAGTVTGLAASGVTFSSGQWHFTLTAGTTPRNLAWTIID